MFCQAGACQGRADQISRKQEAIMSPNCPPSLCNALDEKSPLRRVRRRQQLWHLWPRRRCRSRSGRTCLLLMKLHRLKKRRASATLYLSLFPSSESVGFSFSHPRCRIPCSACGLPFPAAALWFFTHFDCTSAVRSQSSWILDFLGHGFQWQRWKHLYSSLIKTLACSFCHVKFVKGTIQQIFVPMRI